MDITKMDNQGRGITYFNNKIVFVNNALPNEDVDVKIILDKKKYSIANVIKYNKISDKRIKPKCKYYDICGGCQLQHLSYSNQIEYKKNKVNEIFKKFNNVIEVVYDKDFYYRNKLTLQVNNELGLYKINSNNCFKLDECIICNKKINEHIKYLKNLDKNSIKQIIIKSISNETLINIIGSDNVDITKIKDFFEHIYVNNKCIKGGKLIANIDGIKYYVSADAFFQVNPYITNLMYNYIKQLCIKVGTKKVLDLYCGCGSISLFIAQHVNYVYGVEINEDSIKDANNNKRLNNITNAEFSLNDTNDIKINNNFDTLIVDPPRSGLSKKVLNKILNSNIDNIIYVSCDPFTLKRDLELLQSKYDINIMKAFDMFPNTYHVECVSLLYLKNI